MDERDSKQSFFGSVKNGFTNGFSFGVGLSSLDMSLKSMALVIRRRQILRTSAVASAVVTGGLMGGVILGTIHGANYSVQEHAADTKTAMIAGGFMGAMSEIPVYLRHKAGATLTTSSLSFARSQGMHMMRRRPLFLTKAIVGAHIGGFLYLFLRV